MNSEEAKILEKKLRAALVADAGDIQTRTSLGVSLLSQGKLLEAESELKEVLRLKPNDKNARRFLNETLDRILSEMDRHAENITEGLSSLNLDNTEMEDLIGRIRKERFEKVYSDFRQ